MAENGFGGWGGRTGAQNEPQDITFGNVRILDGSGEPPFSGDVTVSGNRIKTIARAGGGFGMGTSSWSSNGAMRIDGRGMTLMPGLIDAHLHLSWNNAPGINPIQMMPLEEHTLNCVYMAKIVLDAGFTAGYGAAAAKPRLDVVIRDAIRSGKVPGPRSTIIAAISNGITLNPGDVIATGTPAGVGIGFKPPKYLVPGDTVRVEISGIGTLSNPFVAV